MNRTGSATLRFFSQSKRNWLGLAALVLLLVGNAAIRLAVAYYLGETVEYGSVITVYFKYTDVAE